VPAVGRLQSGKISIAFLGAAKRSKGFDEFLGFMRLAQQRDPHGYEFSLIGTSGQFATEDMAGITLTKDMLPRCDYLNRLRCVDYVCMPLQRNTYALTVSASLLDCIASVTPLIATRTPAVAHLAADGPIGFLEDNPERLADIVLDRARLSDHVMYDAFQRNLVRLQRQRSAAAVSSAVRATLGNGKQAV
jgi:glycosyltransferase involved in cell wall biosynthesis